MLNLNTSIKNWYMVNFPTDELGSAMNNVSTFNDLYKALQCGLDPYMVLGVGDSIIRERVFGELAELKGVDYGTIYDMWYSVI